MRPGALPQQFLGLGRVHKSHRHAHNQGGRGRALVQRLQQGQQGRGRIADDHDLPGQPVRDHIDSRAGTRDAPAAGDLFQSRQSHERRHRDAQRGQAAQRQPGGGHARVRIDRAAPAQSRHARRKAVPAQAQIRNDLRIAQGVHATPGHLPEPAAEGTRFGNFRVDNGKGAGFNFLRRAGRVQFYGRHMFLSGLTG